MKLTIALVKSVGCVVWCYLVTLLWTGIYFGWTFLSDPLIQAGAYNSVCSLFTNSTNQTSSIFSSTTSSSNAFSTPSSSTDFSSTDKCRAAQLARHQLVFQVASGVVTASSLVFGLLLDHCGARALKLAGTALSCVSLVLLATPFHVDAASSPLHAALVSWALFVGLAAFATSCSMLVLANFASTRATSTSSSTAYGYGSASTEKPLSHWQFS